MTPSDPRFRSRTGTPNLATNALALFAAAGVIAFVTALVTHKSGPLPADRAKSPRIVSLLPQATDIIQSMGCGDHLVAITGFDADPAVANLPRVGDYQTTDWEAIAALHPDWIITHYGVGRTPAGFTEHAAMIGAHQLNLMTETINGDDPQSTIYYAIDELGKICNEPEKAARASADLRSRLSAVRQLGASAPPVPALVVIGAEGTMVAGNNSYLGELLQLAGGKNVAADLTARYPNLDREQLIALEPQVIIQLLPGASPQVIAQAREFWKAMPDVPAVKNARVIQLTGWYVMLPGYHVGSVAVEFADGLHPRSTH